jgi:hypothetical protein
MNPSNWTNNNTMMGPHSINTLDTVTSLTSGTLSGTAGSVVTANGSWSNGAWTPTPGAGPSPTFTVNPSGTIQLEGATADIKINGESLMETLRGIQDRLNMLRPNSELEAEWDELRELGNQYRKLEAEFKEKSKMWNTLKK